MSKSYSRGIIIIIISAIMFGINPAFSLMLRSGGMGLPSSLLFRFIIGVFFYFLLLAKRKKLSDLKIERGTIKELIIAGIFFFTMALTLLASYVYIPSGLSTVIHYSYPMIVMILAVIIGQQKLNFYIIISLILAGIAVVLISLPDSHIVLDPRGIILSIISSLAISIYIILLNQKKLKQLNSFVIVFYIALFFTIVIISWIAIDFFNGKSATELFGVITPIVVIGGIGFGSCCAIGVLLFAIGVKAIGGAVAGAVSTLEPLTAVLVGTILFKEPIPSTFIIASVAIIGSTILLSLKGENS
ncbi:MAG: DMT family transporter [Spirochaetaceae bacterium]|nr:DMT family transporter [Spirochaetaceae bacterium]